MAAEIVQYPVPFDVLDAAVNVCLEGYGPWGTYERTQDTLASTLYTLTANDGGALGSVRVRKVGESLTEIYVEDPPRARLPRGSFTTWQEHRDAERKTDRERKSTARMVRAALYSRLANDGIWDSVRAKERAIAASSDAAEATRKRGAQRLEERPDWPERLRILAEWERKCERQTPEGAAAMVQVPLRTLRNWKARRDRLRPH